MPGLLAAAAVAIAGAALGAYRQLALRRGAVQIADGVWMPLLANGITTDPGVWLRAGGRHLDTAFLYGDAQQALVGRAVRESGLPLRNVFVTTKVMCCPTDRCPSFCMEPPNAVGASLTNQTAQLAHSLELLGLEYVDLLLLHFPCSTWEGTVRAYAALEAALDRGQARAIGVSNFNASALERLLATGARPSVVQNAYSVAGHPAAHGGEGNFCLEGSALYGSTDETLAAAKRHGITMTAYSPLGGVSNVDVAGKCSKVAVARDRTGAQVGARWLTQQGIGAVSATSNPAHARELLASSEFRLTDGEMAALAALR